MSPRVSKSGITFKYQIVKMDNMNWTNEQDIYSNFLKTGHPVKIQSVDQLSVFKKEFSETSITLFISETYLQAWVIKTSKKTSRKAILTFFRDYFKNNHLLFFIESSMKDCQIALKSKNDFYIFNVDFTKPPSRLLEGFETLLQKKSFIDDDMTMRQCALSIVPHKTDIDVSSLTRDFPSKLNLYKSKMENNAIPGEIIELSQNLADFLGNYFPKPQFKIDYTLNEDENAFEEMIISRGEIPIIWIVALKIDDPVQEWVENPLKDNTSRAIANKIFDYREKNPQIQVLLTNFKSFWINNKQSPNVRNQIVIKDRFDILEWNENYEFLMISRNSRSNFERLLMYLYFDINEAIEQVKNLLKQIIPFAKDLRTEISRILNQDNILEDERNLKKYLEEIVEDLHKSIFKDKMGQELRKHFIDLYVQTLIYGIFTGWMQYHKMGIKEKFNLELIIRYFPEDSFLKDIFSEIKIKITQKIKNEILERIEQIFQKTEFKMIKSDTHELMTTFYSDFLELYDI